MSGRQRIRAYNAMEAVDRIALLAASAILLVGCGLGVTALIVAATVVAMGKLGVYHVLLWPDAGGTWRPDLSLLRAMSTVSFR